MALASSGIGFGASCIGLLASYHLGLTAGPAIVLTASAAYAVSVIAGPRGGLLSQWLRPRRLAA